MALTMAVLLALPSYLLLMAKQRAAGVIKTTTNNPVLNCQYQIGGKRPYKNLQKLHKIGKIVVNLYEEDLFAIAAREIVAKSFPIFSDYHRHWHFWQQKSQMVKWSLTISFTFSAVRTRSAGRWWFAKSMSISSAICPSDLNPNIFQYMIYYILVVICIEIYSVWSWRWCEKHKWISNTIYPGDP